MCGEFTGPGEFPAQRPVTRSFEVFFDLRLNKRLSVNNREAGDLRRHRGHYDVIVMRTVDCGHKCLHVKGNVRGAIGAHIELCALLPTWFNLKYHMDK